MHQDAREMGVSSSENGGTPIAGSFIMENPNLKWMITRDLWTPPKWVWLEFVDPGTWWKLPCWSSWWVSPCYQTHQQHVGFPHNFTYRIIAPISLCRSSSLPEGRGVINPSFISKRSGKAARKCNTPSICFVRNLCDATHSKHHPYHP